VSPNSQQKKKDSPHKQMPQSALYLICSLLPSFSLSHNAQHSFLFRRTSQYCTVTRNSVKKCQLCQTSLQLSLFKTTLPSDQTAFYFCCIISFHKEFSKKMPALPNQFAAFTFKTTSLSDQTAF